MTMGLCSGHMALAAAVRFSLTPTLSRWERAFWGLRLYKVGQQHTALVAV